VGMQISCAPRPPSVPMAEPASPSSRAAAMAEFEAKKRAADEMERQAHKPKTESPREKAMKSLNRKSSGDLSQSTSKGKSDSTVNAVLPAPIKYSIDVPLVVPNKATLSPERSAIPGAFHATPSKAQSKMSVHRDLIAGLGLFCIIQNYTFHSLYWDCWSELGPVAGKVKGIDVCAKTSTALGVQSILCFILVLLVVFIVLGVWIGSKTMFAFGFTTHLLGAFTYTYTVVLTGQAIYDDDGLACARANRSLGDRTAVVFMTQVVLYLFYTCSMAVIGYKAVLNSQ